jgi:hypothetical protein
MMFVPEYCVILAPDRKTQNTQSLWRLSQKMTATMDKERIYKLLFSSVYPLYIKKAEAKGRTKEEVDAIIFWLTGYDRQMLQGQIDQKNDFKTFFEQAPRMNPNASKITGVICGYRVEEIDDDIIQKVRYLDKLVDELAKGKAMEKILRR